jgi:hypothetical protein
VHLYLGWSCGKQSCAGWRRARSSSRGRRGWARLYGNPLILAKGFKLDLYDRLPVSRSKKEKRKRIEALSQATRRGIHPFQAIYSSSCISIRRSVLLVCSCISSSCSHSYNSRTLPRISFEMCLAVIERFGHDESPEQPWTRDLSAEG